MLVTLRDVSSDSFTARDEDGYTPLDLYFVHRGLLIFYDPVVYALMSHGGWWGLDALTKSDKAYESGVTLPLDHRVILNGNHYEVSFNGR